MIALKAIGQFPTMKVVTIPLNKDGVDCAELRRLVKRYRFESKSKLFWGVYYTMTIYHNPTGISFSKGMTIGNELLAVR